MEEVIPKQSEARMNAVTATLLILFGFAIDGIQVILALTIVLVVLNYIISLFAWLSFYMWLKIRGMSMNEWRMGMRIIIGLFATAGVEIVTGGAAPGWGFFAIYTVATEYAMRAPVVNKVINKK
jgi:hypothetical protein